MEQTISEIAPSSSTLSDQSKEAEIKKRPNFIGAESHLAGISSGNGICLEGNETVQETLSSHESPRRKRHISNSSDGTADCSPDGISSCKEESRSGGDSSQSAVSDDYTQANGSSFALREGSLQTCQMEKIETIDSEFNKQFVFTEDDQKPTTEVSCSSAGDLQSSSARTALASSTYASLLSGLEKNTEGTAEHDFPKDGHPVNLIKESLCGENVSRGNNATYEVPALVSAETSQSTACCQEEKTSGTSSSLDQSYVCSEQKNVKAAGHSRKKLLILDVNGLLADIVAYPVRGYIPDTWISMKAVFKRCFCNDFLKFCFDNFEVGVWSSRNRKNLENVVAFLMGNKKNKLLFCWDQSHCTDTGYSTIEDRNKPLFLKEIKKLWDKEDPDLPWEKGDYNESNTLLIDDSPHKALRNPPYTGIFPDPFGYKDINDNLLARKGKLRVYLERLAKSDHVQNFIAKNPIGQRPITKANVSWAYYSKIFNAAGTSKQEKKGDGESGEPKDDAKQEPPSEACTSQVATCVDIAEDLTGSSKTVMSGEPNNDAKQEPPFDASATTQVATCVNNAEDLTCSSKPVRSDEPKNDAKQEPPSEASASEVATCVDTAEDLTGSLN